MNYDECIASHTTENLIRESSSCSFIQMPKPLKGRGRAKGKLIIRYINVNTIIFHETDV
ncbi:hypothetical protein X975_21563, partial [Stegodyphus mimosarum]